MSRVVFLDRDGVINEDSASYIKSPGEWIPIPGSIDAIARLCRARFRIVVITNQSGLGRGLFDESTLEAIHTRLRREVEAAGGEIAGIFHCPHLPEEGCRCRKPMPGLIERAEAELGVRARGAPMIGDKESDLLAAARAGCRPILVRTGHGRSWRATASELEEGIRQGIEVYRDLSEAADVILDGAPSGGEQGASGRAGATQYTSRK